MADVSLPAGDVDAALVLASSSPRRRVLLAMIGIAVDLRPADIDEDAIAAQLPPGPAALAVASAKATAVATGERPVLAADTMVVVDEDILGKPTDREHAAAMLRRMSGRSIRVVSGVALRSVDGALHTRSSVSTLDVHPLDDTRIATYLATGEADDKAGALAVQGAAKPFVTLTSGSRSNVYGLPLAETIDLLRSAGITVEEPADSAL